MLKLAVESLKIAFGTKDTVDEPAINNSADAAAWIQWMAGTVKMPELNAVLKQNSIVCPLGSRIVKITAMMKHVVANQ